MAVFRLEHQIKPLPGSKYDGGVALTSVISFVRADSAEAAQVIAEQHIRGDGWAVMSLVNSQPAAPDDYGARVAEKQGWQFVYDCRSVPDWFWEKLGYMADDS